METALGNDAPSRAVISTEAISPNPAVAGVAKVSSAERAREWRRRVFNTAEARAREAERMREWRRRVGNTAERRAREAERKRQWRKANNTAEARAKHAERAREWRRRNGKTDEARAKEAERKRRQREANAGKSSASSSSPTSRKCRAPPADPESYRRRNAERVRAWRAAKAVRDAANNAGADARQSPFQTALFQFLQQVESEAKREDRDALGAGASSESSFQVDVPPVTPPVRNAAGSNPIRAPPGEMAQSRQCIRRPQRRTIAVQAFSRNVGWNVGVQTRTFSVSVGSQTKDWCPATHTTQKALSLDERRDCSTHEP
ncbi:uncharacterized protein LOC119180824 [Rhipicephalus microplus]|uniref:uncharacterized protein LOC119180824 n=1 Tax=Rhipicephalus microplus TaxID=6941 RepID=UPI0018880683|nr:stress response protein nst1-like [Rhipicephalus microplus]